MPFFPSLPGNAGLPQVLALNRGGRRAVLSAQHAMLSVTSRLKSPDKELIAAYASALNAASRGIDAAAAARPFGVDPALVDALVADLEGAPVERDLRPLLAYVRKVTLTPQMLVRADADAVFRHGWTERDLHDAALIAALYVYLNCLQDAHGVVGVPSLFDAPRSALLDCALPLKWLE